MSMKIAGMVFLPAGVQWQLLSTLLDKLNSAYKNHEKGTSVRSQYFFCSGMLQQWKQDDTGTMFEAKAALMPRKNQKLHSCDGCDGSEASETILW